MKKIFLLLCFIATTYASAYQNLTVIINSGPGGLFDQTVRELQSQLSAELGYPIIVDYRPGAKSKLAIQELITHTANNHLAVMLTQISFLIEEENKNIVPFSFVGTPTEFLATKNTVTIEDIQYRCNSNRIINYGTTGTGSPAHIFVVVFDKECANPMQHIPYKGIVPAVTDLLGGQIDLVVATMPPLKERVLSNNAKLLCTIVPNKSVLFADLPACSSKPIYKNIDTGEIYFYSSVAADQNEIKRITQALDKIYATEKFKNFIKSNDISQPIFDTPLDTHYKNNWIKLNQIITNITH